MRSQTTTPRTEDVLSAAERLIGQLDDNAGAVRRLRVHGLTGKITDALSSPTSHTLGGLDSSAISLERSLDQGRASMGAMLCQSLWNHAGISMSSCVHNTTLDLGHVAASRQGSASQQPFPSQQPFRALPNNVEEQSVATETLSKTALVRSEPIGWGARVCSGVEAAIIGMCQNLLPSFDFVQALRKVQGKDENAEPGAEGSDSLRRILQLLNLLQNTIDAKMETNLALRNKQTEDFEQTRRELGAMQRKCADLEHRLALAIADHTQEAAELRADAAASKSRATELFSQLETQTKRAEESALRRQHEHEHRIAEITLRLKSREDELQAAKHRAQVCEAEFEATKIAFDGEMNLKVQDLTAKLDMETSQKERAIEEAGNHRNSVILLQQELENLRLIQKFMPHRGVSKSLQDEQLQLMQKCQSLLAEVKKLRSENVLLQSTVQQLREAGRHDINTSVTGFANRQLQMVLSNEVSDEAITQRLLDSKLERNMIEKSGVCGASSCTSVTCTPQILAEDNQSLDISEFEGSHATTLR